MIMAIVGTGESTKSHPFVRRSENVAPKIQLLSVLFGPCFGRHRRRGEFQIIRSVSLGHHQNEFKKPLKIRPTSGIFKISPDMDCDHE